MGPLVNACAPLGKVLVLARKCRPTASQRGKLTVLLYLAVGDIPVNTVSCIMKGITVGGWPSGHALDSEEAIAFAQHQDVKCMIEKFPMDKVQEAMDHMTSGKVRFRAVLTME